MLGREMLPGIYLGKQSEYQVVGTGGMKTMTMLV